MSIAKEGVPFIAGAALVGIVLTPFAWIMSLICWILGAYFIYFFRDPERFPPSDPFAVLAGADGIVTGVKQVSESEITGIEEIRKTLGHDRLFRGGALRISIFLSLFDVHVNRSPIAGEVAFLKHYPGRRYFTFTEKSSRYNQHNAIVISGSMHCLIHQIVGPVARRVVAWPKLGQVVSPGEKIGIMKFGSRLDMYFPESDITAVVRPGERVVAGESIVATLKKGR